MIPIRTYNMIPFCLLQYGYRMSKVAANMVSRSLAAELRERGVVVVCLHPGAVHTDLYHQYHAGVQTTDTARPAPLTPQQSVSGMLAVVEQSDLSTSGTFYTYDGKVLPW